MYAHLRFAALAVLFLFAFHRASAQSVGELQPEQRDQLRKQQAAAAQGPERPRPQPRRNLLRTSDPAFFRTDEALRIGDQVLAY